jgi:general stress protein 26
MRLHPRWLVWVGTPCGLRNVRSAPFAIHESPLMKIHTQTTPALTQLCELVEHMTVAMLTTANDQGQFVSRPMAPLEMDAEGAIWFFTDLRSSKVEQLSKLNLSFSDMGKATYVSICGRGEIHADQDRIDELWTAFARPWFPEGRTSDDLVLLKVVPDAAEYWDAPHSKMVRLFAVAASVVASKPIGMGEHNMLSGLDPSTSAATYAK